MVKKPQQIDKIDLVRGSEIPNEELEYYQTVMHALHKSSKSHVELMQTCANLFILSLQNKNLNLCDRMAGLDTIEKTIKILREQFNEENDAFRNERNSSNDLH